MNCYRNPSINILIVESFVYVKVFRTINTKKSVKNLFYFKSSKLSSIISRKKSSLKVMYNNLSVAFVIVLHVYVIFFIENEICPRYFIIV